MLPQLFKVTTLFYTGWSMAQPKDTFIFKKHTKRKINLLRIQQLIPQSYYLTTEKQLEEHNLLSYETKLKTKPACELVDITEIIFGPHEDDVLLVVESIKEIEQAIEEAQEALNWHINSISTTIDEIHDTLMDIQQQKGV